MFHFSLPNTNFKQSTLLTHKAIKFRCFDALTRQYLKVVTFYQQLLNHWHLFYEMVTTILAKTVETLLEICSFKSTT